MVGLRNLRSEFCALTSRGLEGVCRDELVTKLGSKVTIAEEGCVFFEYDGNLPLLYQGLRSAHFLIEIISRGRPALVTKENATKVGKTILMRAIPSNNPLESEAGGEIFEQLAALGRPVRIDFKQPETLFRCWEWHSQLIVGIDWGKQQLSKRLRVFTTRFSLNPVSAYALAVANNSQGRRAFLVTNDGCELVEAAINWGGVLGIPINRIIHRGARQNLTVAGLLERVELPEPPWELALESVQNSSLGSMGVQLNFEKDSEGVHTSRTFERLAAKSKPKLVGGGWLNVLVKYEEKERFERLASGYKLESSIEFSQGGLGLALLGFRVVG